MKCRIWKRTMPPFPLECGRELIVLSQNRTKLLDGSLKNYEFSIIDRLRCTESNFEDFVHFDAV